MTQFQHQAFEPLHTLQDAAHLYKVKYWHLQREAKRGSFPIYRVGNGRIRVRLSEIEAYVQRSRVGAGQ